MTNIIRLTDRKAGVRASGPGHYVKQRIADAADQLSLAGTMAARAELCNEALHKLVELAYQSDADLKACNVDLVTLRILIPLPWGSSGWKRWNMRAHEATVLRRILLGRQATWQQGRPAPLFTYDPDGRYWTLNVHDYPRIVEAQAWLQGNAISLTEWRKVSQQVLSGYRSAHKERAKRL